MPILGPNLWHPKIIYSRWTKSISSRQDTNRKIILINSIFTPKKKNWEYKSILFKIFPIFLVAVFNSQTVCDLSCFSKITQKLGVEIHFFFVPTTTKSLILRWPLIFKIVFFFNVGYQRKVLFAARHKVLRHFINESQINKNKQLTINCCIIKNTHGLWTLKWTR